MLLMNWRELFAHNILSRGHGYYLENAVENLQVSDTSISAVVLGTENYEVDISLNGEELTDMHCTCPYAADGKKCKHMAAVLYAWSANDPTKEVANYMDRIGLFSCTHTAKADKKRKEVIKEFVAASKEEEVRAFLASVLAKDERLLLQFYNQSNKQMTQEDIDNYVRQIDDITDRHLGRDNMISYYEANGFADDLLDIINEDVCCMIDNGNYLAAFDVVNYIFVLISEVAIDDSNGSTDLVASRIHALWGKIISKVSKQEKRQMFDWFVSRMDGSIIDYLEEYIEQILKEEFNASEYEQDK